MPIRSFAERVKRMKKILAFALVLLLGAGPLAPLEPAWGLPAQGGGPPITASSAVLIDVATQKFIYAKSPHIRRPPASTTKILTALVVLERVSTKSVVRIPSWVRSIEPSKVYLRRGEHYLVRDLLHATLISSANDASEVLAVATAGSQARFAQWMNERARRIRCRNTHFVNPSGLPSAGQFSTSYDLALIMKEARKNSFIVDSLSQKYRLIRSLEGRKIWLRNHNRFLWRNPRTVIGKTGYTREGRHCFVGRIKWGGREVLVSLLGSHRLWQDLKVLLDYQFGVAFYKIYKNRRHWSPAETRALQAALGRAGYSPGPADGKFGPLTLRAIELFQKKNGIPPDGILGPLTCKRLVRFGFPQASCR